MSTPLDIRTPHAPQGIVGLKNLQAERRAKNHALNELADRVAENEILRLEVALWKKRTKTNGEAARQLRQEIKDLREELDELR